MKLPRLDAQPDVQEATRRLRELKQQLADEEAALKDLRADHAGQVRLDAQAEAIIAGSPPEEFINVDEAIDRAKFRIEQIEHAVRLQSRHVAEVRERVGEKLSAGLRPQYLPILQNVADCVEALQCALARHEDFAQTMAEAGLPWLNHIPLGGIYRRPGLFRNFGTPGQLQTAAAEFWQIAREAGYRLSRKEEPESPAHATASKEVA